MGVFGVPDTSPRIPQRVRGELHNGPRNGPSFPLAKFLQTCQFSLVFLLLRLNPDAAGPLVNSIFNAFGGTSVSRSGEREHCGQSGVLDQSFHESLYTVRLSITILLACSVRLVS